MKQSIRDLLASCTGFDWDDGNRQKNQHKHQVHPQEAEEAFFNQPQVLFFDQSHSQQETRYGLLGITNAGRRLAVFFTLRNDKIRVISVRDQRRGDERHRFETHLKARKEAA